LNSSHVYAVGANGTILRYDGTSWSEESSGTNHYFTDVWGYKNTVWAVGDHGTILKKALPYPDIKANDSDGPIAIKKGENLSIKGSLDVGTFFGEEADWWLLANTPLGWYYFHLVNGWLPGENVTRQGPLINLFSKEVLNSSRLPAGSYTFYFGVDLNMNGSLDMDQIYYDRVKVTINP
jgi:hypothetical protein